MATATISFNNANALAWNLFNSLKLSGVFQIEEKPDIAYNPDFVAKIRKSEEEFAGGKFQTVKTADLWK